MIIILENGEKYTPESFMVKSMADIDRMSNAEVFFVLSAINHISDIRKTPYLPLAKELGYGPAVAVFGNIAAITDKVIEGCDVPDVMKVLSPMIDRIHVRAKNMLAQFKTLS